MKDIETIYGKRTRVRVAGVLLENDGLLLVRHRGLGKTGELWSMPGGGLEFGEDAVTGLKREFKEEAGLDIQVEKFMFVYEFINEPLHAVELYFQVHRTGGNIKTGTDPEVTEQHILETKYVTFEELKVMNPEVKHEILRSINNGTELLNLSGYFKF